MSIFHYIYFILHDFFLHSIYPCVHVSIYLFLHLQIHPSIDLSIYLSLHPSISVSIYIYPFIPSVWPSIHPSIYLSINQSIYLASCLRVCVYSLIVGYSVLIVCAFFSKFGHLHHHDRSIWLISAMIAHFRPRGLAPSEAWVCKTAQNVRERRGEGSGLIWSQCDEAPRAPALQNFLLWWRRSSHQKTVLFGNRISMDIPIHGQLFWTNDYEPKDFNWTWVY